MIKKDFLEENRKLIYGILSVLFVFALLIHWNHNYRKYDFSSNEIIETAKLVTIEKAVNDYLVLHDKIKSGTNINLMLGELKHFQIDNSYEKWEKTAIPATLEASIFRLSLAKAHMKLVKECASEQLRLIEQDRVVPEELKNKTGNELTKALQEALNAGNIINEYKKKNR